MNYSQGFYNMKDYMIPSNLPTFYGNIQMPVIGMACMDNMGYPSSMPFIPDSYIPTKSNMPMPNGDMPAMPNMPMNNMPNMPMNNMPNMKMPTYPSMPGMPMMPGMPGNNRPPYPIMPNIPEENMQDFPMMPGTQMNCKQLYEYMKRMNCMEELNKMNDMEIDKD